MIERSGETPAEHRSGEPVETKLHRIAGKAREEPKLKFATGSGPRPELAVEGKRPLKLRSQQRMEGSAEHDAALHHPG